MEKWMLGKPKIKCKNKSGLLGWEVDRNSSRSQPVTGCISDVLPL
jgi:hypothetical protein